MKNIVDQAMNEKITAKVGGRLVKMTKGQALVARLLERGLGGDIPASRTLLQLIQKYEDPPDPAQYVEPDRPLSAEEVEVFARFMSRHSERPSGEAA